MTKRKAVPDKVQAYIDAALASDNIYYDAELVKTIANRARANGGVSEEEALVLCDMAVAEHKRLTTTVTQLAAERAASQQLVEAVCDAGGAKP